MEGATHSQRMRTRFRLGIKFEELLIVWLSCFLEVISVQTLLTAYFSCFHADSFILSILVRLGKNSICLSHLMSRHSCCATKGSSSSEACSMV